MTWKISEIKITNFKFFKDEFPIPVNRKHLLLFGENGSGKSSIYWSIFNLLQAVTKTEDENRKYFTPGHPQNLRNRFAQANEEASIEITFSNGSGALKTAKVSQTDFYPSDPELKSFVKNSLITSDFLNYRFLASLFEFDNSQPNEVFHIFQKHILPILTFPGQYTLLDGTPSGDGNSAN